MTPAQGPIDLDHLNQYTGGDRAVNYEVLRLFQEQCATMLARLEALAAGDGAGGKIWKETAHTLKGAARGVGASEVAGIAADMERISGDSAAAVASVQRLKAQIAIVNGFVDELLKE